MSDLELDPLRIRHRLRPHLKPTSEPQTLFLTTFSPTSYSLTPMSYSITLNPIPYMPYPLPPNPCTVSPSRDL